MLIGFNVKDGFFFTTGGLEQTKLLQFGQFVSQSMPKFVQGCQLASCDELEVLVSPEGILPILELLRDHTNGQFKQLMDMTAVDVPSRPYRFEVLLLFSRASSM